MQYYEFTKYRCLHKHFTLDFSNSGMKNFKYENFMNKNILPVLRKRKDGKTNPEKIFKKRKGRVNKE
ncbi:hypothetical protein BpHYR1_021256 [Brachionus plicatilis]|uniref:Uncharacterized protein n=1 Tax=Brachionus plicatilis TaxID=10195 RepID=A0A3M7PYR9_BRAPC|nr:hypothetical protein BpHYR1_021256 [Brachionus plicatilis]